MPSIRIGYSSEFVLRNELVGIGSTATSERLDVAGQIRSENTAGSGGVSTFREYQGFSQVEAEVSNNILIDSSSGPYSSLTGEIKITSGKICFHVLGNTQNKDSGHIGKETKFIKSMDFKKWNNTFTFAVDKGTYQISEYDYSCKGEGRDTMFFVKKLL